MCFARVLFAAWHPFGVTFSLSLVFLRVFLHVTTKNTCVFTTLGGYFEVFLVFLRVSLCDTLKNTCVLITFRCHPGLFLVFLRTFLYDTLKNTRVFTTLGLGRSKMPAFCLVFCTRSSTNSNSPLFL